MNQTVKENLEFPIKFNNGTESVNEMNIFCLICLQQFSKA